MNFHIEKTVASGGRLGKISQIVKGNTITLETPMCTLFTKGGSAPYLGLNMLDKIKNVPEIATMSVNSFVDHHDSIRSYGKGLADFSCMKERLIFSSLYDSSVTVQSGKNDKSGIAVWGKGGKTMLDPKLYMRIQEALQPDWILALGDGDTDQENGEKRNAKAVDRTLDWLDDIVSAKEKSELLKSSSLIGVITGGFSERQRQRSATETSARPVHGFLLEGFHKGIQEENVFENSVFQSILSKTLSYLPESKPRITESPWSPAQVTQAFKLGVDVFSSTYPHTLTEKGQALTADFRLPKPSSTETIEKGQENKGSAERPVIDLNDKKYFEDFGPVMEGCECYTCRTFTRSYIHHLLNTSELLAFVLLTIHNFEQYFEFFRCLRQAAKAGRLDELETRLITQASNCSTTSTISENK